MKKNLLTLILCLFITAILSMGISKPVLAEDKGAGYSITPNIFELKANPGDKLDEVISIYNGGSQNLNIGVSKENLKPIGDVGQVQVTNEEVLPSLKNWIVPEISDFTLAKNQTKNIKFSINVPANASPGGHFGTVLFGTAPVSIEGGGSAIAQKIGALVLLTISGDVQEKANITKFTTEKKSYFKNDPINFNISVENKSNVYIRPRGYVVINDIFGRKVAQITVDGKNILPGATRKIPLKYKQKHFFGPYTTTLTLVYGSTNQNLNASTGFGVWPLKTIIIFAIIIFIVLLLRKRLWDALLVIIGKKK